MKLVEIFLRLLCLFGMHDKHPDRTALNGAIVYSRVCIVCGRVWEYER